MVTAADYARAERLCWEHLGPVIRNRLPVPYWLGATDHFIYRHESESGHEFLRVDAATGTSHPAFDHHALALALRSVGEEDADAARLHLDMPAFREDGSLAFSNGPVRYCFDGERCEAIHTPARPHDLSYSPDGLFAVAARGGNLWRYGPAGDELQLTFDGAPDNGYGVYFDNWKGGYIPRARSGCAYPPFCAIWSPCSRWLIAPRIDQRGVAQYPFVESVPVDSGFRPRLHLPRIPLMGEAPADASWYVFDMLSGESRRIDLPDGLFFVHQDALLTRRYWWSGDGSRAYVLAHGDNMGSAMLFDVTLATGAVRSVIEDRVHPRADLNGSSYNPPNVWILGDLDEVIWFSVRDGWGHLYLYDGRTGALKHRMTEGEWFVRDLVHVDTERRQVYFTACGREGGNPYYRYLYRLPLDGGDPVLLSPEPADHELNHAYEGEISTGGSPSSPISPSGRYVVYTYSTAEDRPRTVIRSARDGTFVVSLVKADTSAVLAAGYRPPQTFSVQAADGTALFGVIYSPPAIEPGRKYPVIVSQYTTPIAPASPKTYMRAMAGSGGRVSPPMLAELGFVVISLDPRGTGYRGRPVDGAMDGRLHLMGMDDYVAAIGELGRRFDWFDANRVGIYGGSYGGFAVIRAMLEFPETFTVGVASVPMCALHTMYPDYHWTAYQGAPVYAEGPRSGNTDEVPVNYRSLDAGQQADRLAGHLLIIMAELDENVLPGSAMQFIAALVESDRPFDMLVLPGASHGSFSRTRHYVRRHFDYFVEHLMGASPPRDFRFSLPQTAEPDLSGAMW